MSPSSTNSAHDPGGRRDTIVDIAARSFAKLGFHGVSMRDIARENDSSVATLYNHFPSKDALMLAIGERFYASFVRDLRAAAGTEGDGLTRLMAMLGAAYDNGRRHRFEFLALSHDTRHVALADGLAPLVAWRNECVQLWQDVLREGMDDGSIAHHLDPLGAVWIIFYAITGILEDARSATFATVEDPLGTLCALLSEGLRPRAEPAG